MEAASGSGINISQKSAKKLVDCLDQILYFQKSNYSIFSLNIAVNHWILTRPFVDDDKLYSMSQDIEAYSRNIEPPKPLNEPPQIDEETEYYDILMNKFLELENQD